MKRDPGLGGAASPRQDWQNRFICYHPSARLWAGGQGAADAHGWDGCTELLVPGCSP